MLLLSNGGAVKLTYNCLANNLLTSSIVFFNRLLLSSVVQPRAQIVSESAGWPKLDPSMRILAYA